MKKLVVVQCGGKKVWNDNPNLGKVEAKNAYTSPYFQKNRLYAEKIGDKWMILSAKYGFIEPSEQIENYNVTFKQKKTNPITFNELKDQVKTKKLNQYDKIIVLGGKEYLYAIKEAFQDTNCNIESPFEGLTIGIRMSKLNEELQKTCKI
ncbi:hypothetical protein MBGDF03_00942 [Thermoplasmatales archaeon SCGC AB-540-F20]|nr:hypothetical protein MBGDF03_00942 [Thermoplasmatales archaeon SCGC AB-540-F20]